MKKLYILLLLLFFTLGLFSQSGTVNLKYPTVVPSLNVNTTAKIGTSIYSNVNGVANLGIYGNGWNNLFMSRGSRIYFDSDTTFGKLYFDYGYGDLHLDAHLDLGDNDLFLNGSIGSDDRKVQLGKFRYLTADTLLPYSIGTPDTVVGYGYFDSIYVNSLAISGNIGGITLNSGTLTLTGADPLTFQTSATTNVVLPTSGILYSSSNNIIPGSSSTYTIGSTSMPFNSLYLSGGAINFNNGGGSIAYSPGDDDFYIGGAGIQLLTGDLGKSLAPVNKGWFTDLDIVNLPTLGSGAIATTQNINDSIAEYLNNATIGVAAIDSNTYGGYTTRTYVESLLGSGSGLSASRLPFIIGVTTGAPSASDSTITHSAFDGKHIDLYRDGAKQYQQFTATNIYEGFRVNGSTITVNPAWQANEQVMVDIIEPILWSYLSLEGQESSLLDGLRGYWKLDETSGTIVTDATGTQNGTRSAGVGVSVSGKLGYANTFNTSNDYIAIPYNTNISPKGSAFSISAWIKLDSLPSVVGHECYIFQQNVGVSPWSAHWIYVDDSDNRIIVGTRNSTNTVYYVRSTDALIVGTWYHIVFINSGNGQALKLYVNGLDVSFMSDVFSGSVLEGLDTSCFGTSYTFSDAVFEGAIDSPAIWSRALTAGEVTTLYNSGNGRTYPFN